MTKVCFPSLRLPLLLFVYCPYYSNLDASYFSTYFPVVLFELRGLFVRVTLGGTSHFDLRKQLKFLTVCGCSGNLVHTCASSSGSLQAPSCLYFWNETCYIPNSFLSTVNTSQILAKDLVRTRNYVTKFIEFRSHLQGVGLKLETVRSHEAMASAMKDVTKAMVSLNKQVSLETWKFNLGLRQTSGISAGCLPLPPSTVELRPRLLFMVCRTNTETLFHM